MKLNVKKTKNIIFNYTRKLVENNKATRTLPLVVVLGTQMEIWFWGRNSKFCFGHNLQNDFLKVHKKFGVTSYKNEKVIKIFKYKLRPSPPRDVLAPFLYLFCHQYIYSYSRVLHCSAVHYCNAVLYCIAV